MTRDFDWIFTETKHGTFVSLRSLNAFFDNTIALCKEQGLQDHALIVGLIQSELNKANAEATHG